MQVFCSPLRYVQGISASNQLAQQMDAVGMNPQVLLVSSKSARLHAEKAWQESMKQMGWEFSIIDFTGECTPKEIDSVVARAKDLGSDVNDLNVINSIAKRATQPGETIHNEPFPVTEFMVADALRAADALASQV